MVGNLHGIRRARSCWVVSMPKQRRVHGMLRRLGRTGFDERPGGAFERAVVVHARRPSWATAAGSVSAMRAVAESGEGVVESRSGRPRGDLEEFRDLHEGQPEVVMQHEDRPLFDREPAERPLQLVAVGEGGAAIRRRWPIHGQDADLRRPLPRPLRFVVAGVDEDAMDPGFEPLRLPKIRESAPGQHEGILQRVLGQTRVAQDPMGDGVEGITDLVHQDREGLPVARSGPFDEVSIHLDPSGDREPGWPRTTHYDGRQRPERSAPDTRHRSVTKSAYSAAMSGPKEADSSPSCAESTAISFRSARP